MVDDLSFNLFIVFSVFNFLASFNLNRKFKDVVSLVNELLESFFLELELDRDVTSVDTLLKALNCSTNVGVCVDKLTLVKLLKLFFLLIWENDIASEGLSHKQILAKGTGTSSENFIRVSWDNRAKSEDKTMDHLFVKEESGDGIRDGILGELLRLVHGIWEHQLRVKLNRVISKFSFGDGFKTVTTLRKVSISFNPIIAIDVDSESSKHLAHA